MTKFSIIIPTYNRSSFIAKTINSLLSQKNQDFEIIVVDDGSTDNTEDVVNSFNNKKIRYFRKDNGERGAARNFGTGKATGSYINFFDSDDLAYENHISEAENVIRNNPEIPIFHLAYDLKTPEGSVKKLSPDLTDKVNREIIDQNYLSCNGVFVKREIALKFPFPEDRRMAASEDWALWLILASRYPILHHHIITSSIVDHDGRSMKDYDADKIITRDLLLVEYLMSDTSFTSYYKNHLKMFVATKYTFFSLLLGSQKKRLKAIKYLLKSITCSLRIIFTRRFLASLKHIILR
jgi:glycosyltransferase involved in cell wall biosynthesis